jgi:hypothetical protein
MRQFSVIAAAMRGEFNLQPVEKSTPGERQHEERWRRQHRDGARRELFSDAVASLSDRLKRIGGNFNAGHFQPNFFVTAAMASALLGNSPKDLSTS